MSDPHCCKHCELLLVVVCLLVCLQTGIALVIFYLLGGSIGLMVWLPMFTFYFFCVRKLALPVAWYRKWQLSTTLGLLVITGYTLTRRACIICVVLWLN